jgi:hypothetical protein
MFSCSFFEEMKLLFAIRRCWVAALKKDSAANDETGFAAGPALLPRTLIQSGAGRSRGRAAFPLPPCI